MARRRAKRRTHAGANNPNQAKGPINTGNASIRDPKSMVIRIGASEVGSSVSQLATDVRRVMEPGTASRLKERRANKLKDYLVMCGPLGVTHLLLFSRSESGNVNLRVALTPRGPTLHFRVEKYSLTKDVQQSQRRPKGQGKEFITSPLLVMNNFSSASSEAPSKTPKHLESLTTTVFQSLFAPINPQTTPLKSIRRVLLMNREQSKEEDGSFIIDFRHYAITTKPTGISKPLKRLNAAEKLLSGKTGRKGGLPNLSKLQDISDFMIGGEDGSGYMTDGTSGSEAETDAEVEVLEPTSRKVLSGKARAALRETEQGDEGSQGGAEQQNVEKRAVKLAELGPRMRLRLLKVEEGVCAGKVMWHEYIHKSKEEIKEMEKKWEQKQREKDARKKIQKENVERKRKEKEEHKKKSKKSGDNADGADDDDDDHDDDNHGEMEVDYDSDDYGFDSEGIAGDAETLVNEKAEENEEWEDEEEEIAAGAG